VLGCWRRQRLTTGLARRIRESLGKALLLINARMAVQAAEGGKPKVAAHHVAVLRRSGFPGELITESLRDSVGHVRQRVTLLCGPAKEQALANPKRAHRVVRLLLKQVKPPLALLDRLLPAADPMRQCAHDDVADCALQCQVIYGNATEDWRTSLELLEKVLPVAGSESTRLRLQQNIDIVKDNIKFGLCFFCQENPPDEVIVATPPHEPEGVPAEPEEAAAEAEEAPPAPETEPGAAPADDEAGDTGEGGAASDGGEAEPAAETVDEAEPPEAR